MFRKSSVDIAKKRLKKLVNQDRIQILPDSQEIVRKELYHVLSRYVELTEDDFNIEIYRTHIMIQLTGENS